MKTILTYCFTLIIASSAFAALMDTAAFTRKYASKLLEKQPSLNMTIVEPLHLKVTNKDNKEYTLFLDNAYSEYKLDESQLDDLLERYVLSSLETINYKERKLDISRIVPVIKDFGYIEEAKKSLEERGMSTDKMYQVYQKYNDSLIILYAEDTPNNIRYFNDEDLSKTNLIKSDLRKVAIKNLNNLLPKIELHGADGFYMMTAGGDYEASLILFDTIWEGDQIKVDGDYVITIPSRDLLVITGSNNSAGIKKLKEIAEQAVKENSYHLTDQLFIYKGNQFVEYN